MLITSCLVQVDAWLIHLFMVHVDYRLISTGCYSGISHSDNVTMVSSFDFYASAVGRGNERWL
jgi:hypothetical protein